MKKSVGGKIITTTGGNQELITWESCGLNEGNEFIVVDSFFIKNEGEQDTFVKINGGSEMLLKPKEILRLSGLTNVESCVVVTSNSRVRWGGLL